VDLFEVALAILTFILGLFLSWYFYRKERKENEKLRKQNEANAEIIKQLRQYIGAKIRLGNDKRGKIVERPDGTIAIDWTIELKEPVTVSATPRVEVEKKKE